MLRGFNPTSRKEAGRVEEQKSRSEEADGGDKGTKGISGDKEAGSVEEQKSRSEEAEAATTGDGV